MIFKRFLITVGVTNSTIQTEGLPSLSNNYLQRFSSTSTRSVLGRVCAMAAEALESIRQAVHPCEVVCKCLGLIPLFMEKDLPAWKQWANSAHLLLTALFIIRAIWHCMPIELDNDPESMVMKHSGVIMIVSYYIQPIGGTVTSRMFCGQIWKIFKKLDVMDSKFKMLNCPSQHRKETRFVLISTTCAIVGSFYSLMLYTVYPLKVDVEYVFELIYFTWHYSLSCVYASSISYVLLERCKLMNKAISNKFPPCKLVREVATASKINEDQQLKSLENIRFIVDELNETIDLVNSFFSTQVRRLFLCYLFIIFLPIMFIILRVNKMLCCVGITFVIGVGCSFYLFRAFIYRSDQLFMGAINFIWYMYYLSFVLLFIVTASKISDESQRTGIIVHKAINFCHTSRTVVKELMIFSQQLLHYKPIITCGLFAYNGSLLYTMLGATATYLIIMIQFDVSFPSLAIVNSTETQQL